MPLRLGLLVYPLFILALVWGKSAGTVSKFVKAGATSPATARKPASLEITDMVLVKRAEQRGALISTGDGRYYVNVPRLLRVRKRFRAAAIGATVVFAALAVLAWHPWMRARRTASPCTDDHFARQYAARSYSASFSS